MKKNYSLLIVLILLFTACNKNLQPAKNISLPSIFSDNMVLQQNMPIIIWGNADKISQVKIQMDNETLETVETNDDGRWKAELKPMKAGGPHTLKVIGIDTIKISDVMIGEVWICSGQSNMEFQMSSVRNRQEEIDAADYKDIRLFTVNKTVAEKPMNDCEGIWDKCTPETVVDFSAVGYFFGRELYKKLHVPIGLIHSSWGGTPIEAWMSYKTLESDSDFIPILKRFNESLKNYPEKLSQYKKTIAKLKAEGKKLNQYQIDKGNQGIKLGYADFNYNDTKWKTMALPSYWDGIKNMNIDGAVWFRKAVDIPENWIGQKLVIELGSIDDFDITYFNGIKIGATGEDTPNFWTYKRKYIIPSNLTKSTNCVIAVRVFDHFGTGGFGGPRRRMLIYREADPDNYISLTGDWKYKVETALDPSNITGPGGNGWPTEPLGPKSPHRPSGLYNGMIYPLAPFAIRGVIWYQGETNAGRAYQYRKLLPAMIKNWRTLWNNSSMFFGIVSLANFMQATKQPEESDWAELREAQYLTVKNDPNTSLAVTIDIGNADDVHPKNKQDVGKRLALGALAKVYGFNIEYSGPEFSSYKNKGDRVILSFAHIDKELTVKGNNQLNGFSIAGKDKKFVWANAKIIDKSKVEVWSENVKKPIAVRYDWANNPKGNLYNSAGLPAIPFRTDNFDEITKDNK